MKKLIAACTTLAPTYPGFLNVSRDENGSFIVTVRGDPIQSDGNVDAGPFAAVTLTAGEWQTFVAEAAK